MEGKMHVNLYIFKVQREFIEESTRYIAKAHVLGTPRKRWADADSLVELQYMLHPPMPGFEWGEIETNLENKGGHMLDVELTEAEFSGLFSRWSSD